MTAVTTIPTPSDGGERRKQREGGDDDDKEVVRDDPPPAGADADPRRVVSSIESRINRGTDPVGPDDLAVLRSVLASEEGAEAVPTLDRAYLRHGGGGIGGTRPPANNGPTLVRFVGMVQDQLEPEFYQTRVNGRYTKYRDYVYGGGDTGADDAPMTEDSSANNDLLLAERHPLVVVPVPFSSGWFRGGAPLGSGGTAGGGSKSGGRGEEERGGPIPGADATATAAAAEQNSGTGSRGSKRPVPAEDSRPAFSSSSPPPAAAAWGGGDDDVASPARKVRQSRGPGADGGPSFGGGGGDDGGDDALSPMSIPGSDSARSPSLGAVRPSEPAEHGGGGAASAAASAGGGGAAADWWPAGCMGSDPDQVPVLAKLYYDDDHDEKENDDDDAANNDEARGGADRRLRLNDLVEMYGLVHFDPMEADFAGQSGGGAAAAGAGGDGGGDYDDMFGELSLLSRAVLPPPSLLPRLHVLCYERLDLDGVARGLAAKEEGRTCPEEEGTSQRQPDGGRSETVEAFAEHVFGGNTAAAEALLVALMSKVERETQAGGAGRPVETPTGLTLGCASLNFVVPDMESCDVLAGRLRRMLDQVLPVVASVDLTREALAAGERDCLGDAAAGPGLGPGSGSSRGAAAGPVSSPAKNSEGRLVPTPVQLPGGSGLIINQGPLREGRISEHGRRTLVALSDLTRKHTVPYRFDGMMDYPFEGDYRVIVVSSAAGESSGQAAQRREQNRLLPCSMRMNLGEAVAQLDDDTILPPEKAKRIRLYVSTCRAFKSSGAQVGSNIALSREILAQAEKDFVHRRVESRENKTSGSIEIGEEDFHRWLTMTRLQARSRISSKAAIEDSNQSVASASIEDWKLALELDDAMRA